MTIQKFSIYNLLLKLKHNSKILDAYVTKSILMVAPLATFFIELLNMVKIAYFPNATIIIVIIM